MVISAHRYAFLARQDLHEPVVLLPEDAKFFFGLALLKRGDV